MHFCFRNALTYDICNQVTSEIERIACQGKQIRELHGNVKEIYDAVVTSKFMERLCDVNVEENKIPTLHTEYKTAYNEIDWKKVCLFEWHFVRSSKISNVRDDSFENLIERRWHYFQCLVNTSEVADSILNESTMETITRLQRKEVANIEENICVIASHRHSPLLLELQLMSIAHSQDILKRIICVDCTKKCDHSKSVHVYLEATTNSIDDLISITMDIKTYIAGKHNEHCAEVLVFSEGTFKDFETEDGNMKRFQIRDKILCGDFKGSLIYQWNDNDYNKRNDSSDVLDNCEQCYGMLFVKPLASSSFDVLNEWILETPLLCQVIFEKFVNSRSMKRAKDTSSLLPNKYRRLYGIYDALLNTFNRRYHGVLQEMQTQQLTLNAQSVSTVFGVTSSSGATKSLIASERNLKVKSESECTYYNTFLRKYPFEYESNTGSTKSEVNLRGCAIILMMDNLVRMKYHRDPDPGEHRSMQICTLPITIKGLPLDASVIKTWHNPSCTQPNQTVCDCMKEIPIVATELQEYILTMTEEEHTMLQKFHMLCCFGDKNLWKIIIEDKLHLTCAKYQKSDDLEASLASLNLDETEDYDVEEMETRQDNIDTEVFETEWDEDIVEEKGDYLLMNLASIEVDETAQIKEFNSDWSFLGESFDEIEGLAALHDDQNNTCEASQESLDITIEDETPILDFLGFKQYSPPPLLTRHPPPAVGRDDDIEKLQEILDDILVKMENDGHSDHKILFGPDQKIASNLLKLQERDKKYDIFLPEFPLLHLRKSKITILCSAYKDAGILHILKYMRDEDFNEWKKLISADHIEKATTYIRRLAISMSIAFFCVFIQNLPEASQVDFSAEDFSIVTVFQNYWEDYLTFVEEGKRNNGTFALHLDMLKHCEEVCAISLAERLGGKAGYTLLLAAVKSSLPFSFLNGASSYAGFTTKLLQKHIKCGEYYKNMKFNLYTTPNKGSSINFALDTQREMDHRDALKAFRTGGTPGSIIPRMSLLDSLNDINEQTEIRNINSKKSQKGLLGMSISSVDVKYICRMV